MQSRLHVWEWSPTLPLVFRIMLAFLGVGSAPRRAVGPAGRRAVVARLRDLTDENLTAIFEGEGTFLDQERPKLLGELSSSALLEADNRNGVLPPGIDRDASLVQLVYVDEPSCIGCRYCTQIARSTFRMEGDFGAARAFQQLGDEPEVVEEARDCCPVDCIHSVSFAELKVLEAHRQGQLDSGAMAAAQGAGKLAARAEGRDRAPNWRAPLARVRLDQVGGLEEPSSGGEAELGDESLPPPPGQELGWETLASLYPDDEEFGE